MFYLFLFCFCLYLLLYLLDLPIRPIYGQMLRNNSKQASALQQFLELDSLSRKHLEVPEYKFYGGLVSVLLNMRSVYGASIEDHLFEIKRNLKLDIKESRKIDELFLGGLFQIVFSALFMITFFWLSHFILEIRLDLSHFIFLSSWFFLGLLFYIVFFHWVTKKKLKNFKMYIKAFYEFKVLLSVSRPLNEVLERSGISRLIETKKLKAIKGRIDQLISKIKSSGQYQNIEMQLIIEEIWDYFEFELTSLQKINSVLRLFLMTVFVLPAFMYTIFVLFERLQL